MSDKNDQITNNTDNSFEGLEKDPKKVAAGKRLAEYNKNIKELIESEKQKVFNSKTPKPSKDNIVPLLIGLTALVLFLRYMTHHQEAASTSAVGME